MNAQLRPEPELLPPTGTAIAEFSPTSAGLAELRSQLAGVSFDCSTAEGDKQARESRRMLVTLRTSLESRRKELKAPLLERERLIDDEAKRITGEIVALESPIDALIVAEEKRKDDARKERARIEAERAAAISKQIDTIRNMPLVYISATAPVLREAIEALASRNLAEVFDGADLDRAEDAASSAMKGLSRALEARVEADAETERQRVQREELERQVAQQAEAQRIADEEAAAARAEADRIAREKREADDAAARVEQYRVAAEQKAAQDKIDADRADLDRQQAEARKASTKAAEQKAAREAKKRADEIEAQRKRWASREVDPAACMTGAELDSLCQLLLVSDPWPLGREHGIRLADWADAEARRHGFEHWVDALHGLAQVSA